MSEEAFSLLHPGVKKALWTMRWKQLHPIQVEAIHHIVERDGHLIVCAQTAGGKTEAAFLPIVSKLASAPRDSVQAMYVGPLKALINDQFERLERLCAHLDIPVHRWHGDVSASQKKALRDAPGGILLITPESLESNFINYGTHLKRIYRDLEFVVIDELHSFLSNVRGIHLRSLLARLSAATGRQPRVVGLSATLGDPLAARAFIAVDQPDTVAIVNDTGGTKEVRLGIRAYLQADPSADKPARLTPEESLKLANGMPSDSFESRSPANDERDELDEIAEDVLQAFSTGTNLVFGNAKQSLEILADRLHQLVRARHLPADPFMVHHGSLAKDLREETEEVLKSGRPATALCSSTLELGVDIGSVRAVGQLDPPWSVASTVQRLGRSGRREGQPAIMRMYVRDHSPHAGSGLSDLIFPHLLRAIAIVRLMVAKWLEPLDTDRMHLSTLVHQILSCLRQTGGMRADDLHRTLIVKGPFRNVAPPQFAQLLRDLGVAQLIEQMPQGELILAPGGEKLTASFDFYAAFQASEEYSVRHGTEEIGMLQSSLVPPVGENVILAGRRWRVDEIVVESKCVFVSVSRGGKPPKFQSSGGEIHSRIVQEMKAVLHDAAEPPYLDEPARLLLRAAQRTAETSGLLRSDVLIRPGIIQWFPWLGSRGLQTLSLYAESCKIEATTDAVSISYRLPSQEAFCGHLQGIANSQRTPLELARLMPVKQFEKYDSLLCDDLLVAAIARDRLDVSGAVDAARETLRVLNAAVATPSCPVAG